VRGLAEHRVGIGPPSSGKLDVEKASREKLACRTAFESFLS